MDFEKLIADFAERHGIANLAAEGNAAALDIDGVVVTLVAVDDTLSVSADIGEPPVEGRADFATGRKSARSRRQVSARLTSASSAASKASASSVGSERRRTRI